MSFTDFIVSHAQEHEQKEKLKALNEDQLTIVFWNNRLGLMTSYDRAGNDKPVYVDEAVAREAAQKFLAAEKN